jgi:DNA repair exonuclease SbcCD ATPase subunit
MNPCLKCGGYGCYSCNSQTPAAPLSGESGEEHARKRAEYDAMFVKPAPQSADELDHPCRETCSGWKQGYERGKSESMNPASQRQAYEALRFRDQRIERLEAECAKLRKYVGDCEYEKPWITVDRLTKELFEASQIRAHCAETIAKLTKANAELKDAHGKYCEDLDSQIKELRVKLEESDSRVSHVQNLNDKLWAERDEWKARAEEEQESAQKWNAKWYDTYKLCERLANCVEQLIKSGLGRPEDREALTAWVKFKEGK